MAKIRIAEIDEGGEVKYPIECEHCGLRVTFASRPRVENAAKDHVKKFPDADIDEILLRDPAGEWRSVWKRA